VTDAKSHSTLREWRAHLTHPLTLAALAAVSAVLALVGPFGTESHLHLLERLAYWSTLVVSGYVLGYVLNSVVIGRHRAGDRLWLWVTIAGLLTGLGMTAIVTALNFVVFRIWPEAREWPAFLGTILVISVIVMTVIDMFSRRLSPRESAATRPESAPALPPILERLPFDKRGALVALSVEDHYVRVRTVKGEEMLLMRLADAMREVGDTSGAQVHRSHWAAFDQVTQVTRQGDRAVLTMSVGADVPVSRTNLPKLKEAGLLPR